MGDGAAEIAAVVSAKLLVDVSPTRLPGQAAAIAGKTYDVESPERRPQVVRPVEVAKMDVVVDKEHDDLRAGRLGDRGVVYGRKALRVSREEAHFHRVRPMQAQ